MRTSLSRSLVAAGLVAAAAQAQIITVPQAAVGAELASSTSYFVNPCLNASCSIRVQYFYAASQFINQGVAAPIMINSLSFRPNGGAIHAGGVTHPNLTIQMSTATPGAILAPNPVFASNHGGDITTVYGPAPVTTLATTGAIPNSPILTIALSTPFYYDPTQGDLVVDSSNQLGLAGTLMSHDSMTTAGANGARVWDFTPGATAMSPSSGNNQPGIVIQMECAYTPAPPGHAEKQKYGAGCYDVGATKREFFATAPTFDLSNTSMSLLYNGTNGYTAVPGISAFQAPGAAAPLALTDDSQTTVNMSGALSFPGGSTTSLVVCSNGFVSVAAGNGTGFTPTDAGWLAFSQTNWAGWHDYNPAAAGSGPIRFHEVGSLSVVTWDGTFDFGQTVGPGSTWQIQFDRATGNVHYVWQGMTLAGNGHLVGFKCGGPVLSTPAIDISAVLPATFQTGCDSLAIALDASARPILNTNIGLQTTRVPATASFSALLLNFAAVIPGLDLTGLGMPGCFQHIALAGATTLGLGFSTSWSQNLFVPNVPAYVGMNLFGQTAAFVPGANPLGVTSSNGLRLVVGSY